MIELKQSPDGTAVILAYVTDFSGSMGFCEYRIRNSLKGIEPIQTQVTIEGTQSHENEAQYEREHFEFKPITQEELEDINNEIEYARESLYTRYLKEYEFGDDKVSLLIFGRADKVKRARNMLIVEESKYPQNMERYQNQFEPYLDQKLQILLYLNSLYVEDGSFHEDDWFTIPHEKKAWIINIKDKATSNNIKTFEGIQNEEAEKFLEYKIDRFTKIVLGKLEPEHHNNTKKCSSCRYSECEYKIQ